MAEEYIRLFGNDLFEVDSAGLEPGKLNPVVVELLKDDGIEIDGKQTKSVFDLHAQGREYDYVIAVCDPEAKEKCPIFKAEKKRLHWPFPDPSAVQGSFAEKLEKVRPIQAEIRQKVLDFLEEYRNSDI